MLNIGSVVRCVKDCSYAKIGDSKKVDEKTIALYNLLVQNGDFEVVSDGDSFTAKAFKEAFAVGADKMPEEFKNALLKGL